MKIIRSSVDLIEQEDLFKHIEYCGRTCYKSTDKITQDSALGFVDRLKNANHGAMLEHGTIYLIIPSLITLFHKHRITSIRHNKVMLLLNNKYTKSIKLPIDWGEDYVYYVTTNYRVIVENNLYDLVDAFESKQTEWHEKRYTFRIICDRSMSHEFVRHRVFSFAQESQRYCNYSKDKYDNEITFIKPCYFEGEEDTKQVKCWLKACSEAEASYMYLIDNLLKPEEARAVLPNSTKTELIMTGFESDFSHFFDLRCAKSAHPQIRELAIKMKEIIDEKNTNNTDERANNN